MSRGVVITGLGVVSALGSGIRAFWEGLDAGRSALRPTTLFDPAGFPCRLAGEIAPPGGTPAEFSAKDCVPKSYRKAVKVMARDTEIAVLAARLAVEDANLRTRASEGEGPTTYPGERMGCQIGAGLISAEAEEITMAFATAVREGSPKTRGFSLAAWGAGEGGGGGMNNLQPLWMLKYLPNMLACHVTIIHGAEGPSNTITCSESSGLLSIGESMRVIERGSADLCFSGGAESKIGLMSVLRMTLAGRLAPTHDEPDGSTIVRPFDPDAKGGVPGEGGGIVILEEASSAAARGARVYARAAGFAASQGATRCVPSLGGAKGCAQAVESSARAAIRDAKISPEDIDAIVPQAAGVPVLDDAERDGLAAIFGPRLADIPAITLAPNLGDCSAGNGSLQLAAGAMALSTQRLPARLHAGTPKGVRAERCPSRPARLRHVLVCSGGMGGQHAAVVLAAP